MHNFLQNAPFRSKPGAALVVRSAFSGYRISRREGGDDSLR